MSKVSQISKRYAKALFESAKNKEATLNELRAIVKLITDDKSIELFFESHQYADILKHDVLNKAIENKGLSQETMGFLLLMAKKGRLSHLRETLISYEGLVDAQNNVTRGTVKSAVKLDHDSRQKIESVVSHFVKKKVILTYSEDPKLVGGVVAQVGGWTFEDTLDSHLRRLKEDLNRRAN